MRPTLTLYRAFTRTATSIEGRLSSSKKSLKFDNKDAVLRKKNTSRDAFASDNTAVPARTDKRMTTFKERSSRSFDRYNDSSNNSQLDRTSNFKNKTSSFDRRKPTSRTETERFSDVKGTKDGKPRKYDRDKSDFAPPTRQRRPPTRQQIPRKASSSSPPPSSLVRLNKLVAQQGACSRREADEWIKQGRVRVNGKAVTELGTKIDMSTIFENSNKAGGKNLTIDDIITVKEPIKPSYTILFHKPLGIVSSQPENEEYQPAVQFLTSENQHQMTKRDKKKRKKNDKAAVNDDDDGNERTNSDQSTVQKQSNSSSRYYPANPRNLSKLAAAGRLDINSTGLLVLTQSGAVARSIIGPTSKMEKEYLVRVTAPSKFKPSTEAAAAATTTTNSSTTTKQKRTTPQEQEQQVHRESAEETEQSLVAIGVENDWMEQLQRGIVDDGELLQAKSIELLHDDDPKILRFVLTHGKHHHLRRMCKRVGWHVKAIKRVRVGNVVLGDLPLGKWRYLQPQEKF